MDVIHRKVEVIVELLKIDGFKSPVFVRVGDGGLMSKRWTKFGEKGGF